MHHATMAIRQSNTINQWKSTSIQFARVVLSVIKQRIKDFRALDPVCLAHEGQS